MMKEILTQRGFSEQEISTLEIQEDYEELRLRVERLQADSLLDKLQTRTEDRVEVTSQTLESKWSDFKADILALESPSSSSEENTTETIEQIQSRIQDEAVERAEEQIRSKVSGFPLIGENIADWIISSGKEYINNNNESIGGKVKNWIFVLIAGFFGVGGIINTLKDEVNNVGEAKGGSTEIPQGLVGEIEIEKETINTLKYEAGISLILGLSEEDNNNPNIKLILNKSAVQSSSFKEIIQEGFTVSDTESSDIVTAQSTLLSQENLIDSILKNENPDWRDLTLLEIFESISVYSQSFLDLENLNTEDILNSNFNVGTLTLGAGGAIGGSLGTLFERYKNSENSVFYGVSEGLLISLYGETNKKISDPDVESLLSGNSFQNNEEDREFQENFSTFGRGMIEVFISDFYLGPDEHKGDFERFLRERSLNYREVLELMILTGNSLDSGSYNDAVKTLLYTRVWKMLGEDPETGNSLRANTYNFALRTSVEGEISNGVENIPPQFIIIGERLGATIVESVTDVLGHGVDIFAEVWNSLSYREQATVVGIAGFSIFALMRTRVFRAKLAGFGIGLQAALLGGIIFMAQSAAANENFRAANPQIRNEADIINLMLREAADRDIDLSLAVDDINSGRSPLSVDGVLVYPNNLEPNISSENGEEASSSEVELQDGYEVLQDSNVNIGNTDVKIERGLVHIHYNGNRRNIFFQSTLIAPPASNIVNSNPSLVKNEDGDIFISVEAEKGEFRYISINNIDEQISGENPEIINVAGIPEYKIYDNFFRGWSLYIDGEAIL